MPKINGTISKKISKSGETNDKKWKRTTYVVNGTVLSTFDESIMDFKEGDNVDIEYEQQGSFSNIKTMELLNKGETLQEEAIDTLNILRQGKKKKKYLIEVTEVE